MPNLIMWLAYLAEHAVSMPRGLALQVLSHEPDPLFSLYWMNFVCGVHVGYIAITYTNLVFSEVLETMVNVVSPSCMFALPTSCSQQYAKQ